MVVHRTCSFCAGDIEPGTGQLFVKRDGSLYAFCSSSCRKQQMGLGRVGHRLRWTKAHELKRLAEQRRQPAAAAAAAPAAKPDSDKSKVPPSETAGAAPQKKQAKPKSTDGETAPKAEDAEAAPKKSRTKKAPAAPSPT